MTNSAKLSAVAGCSTCVSGRDLIPSGATPAPWTRVPHQRAIEVRTHLVDAMGRFRNAMPNDFTTAFAYVHERWGTAFTLKDASLIVRASEEME